MIKDLQSETSGSVSPAQASDKRVLYHRKYLDWFRQKNTQQGIKRCSINVNITARMLYS